MLVKTIRNITNDFTADNSTCYMRIHVLTASTELSMGSTLDGTHCAML